MTSRIVQRLCPSPRRHLQAIIRREGLRTGIDIGCGSSSPLAELRAEGFRSTGVDSSGEMVRMAKQTGLHDEYVVGDVRNMALQQEYDVVVCSHVIEHMTREEGLDLLIAMERIARRIVYVETPSGFLPQGARDGNLHQRHLSGWCAWDFRSRGYSVYGAGLGIIRGVEGRARLLPEAPSRLAERMTQWLVFRHPSLAHSIAAIRYVDESGDLVLA